MTDKTRNWEEEGKNAAEKFGTLVEITVTAAKTAVETAAAKSSSKKDDIGKEVSDFLEGASAVTMAGLFLIAALVQSRNEADKLRRELAVYKEMEELDSKLPDASVSSAVDALVKKYLN